MTTASDHVFPQNFGANHLRYYHLSIPEDIKVATTLCSFKRQLKSFYFKRLYNVFDGDNVRSFKIICPKCRRVNILKACSC